MNTRMAVVWSGDFVKAEGTARWVVWVDVEMHVDRKGDVGFCTQVTGGRLTRLDREGYEYTVSLGPDWEFSGRVCNLPGSVREALRPWREGGWKEKT